MKKQVKRALPPEIQKLPEHQPIAPLPYPGQNIPDTCLRGTGQTKVWMKAANFRRVYVARADGGYKVILKSGAGDVYASIKTYKRLKTAQTLADHQVGLNLLQIRGKDEV